MQLLYEIDYGLPFVPELARAYKPVVFVDEETRKRYYCIYNDGKLKISAKGGTPFEALQEWVKKFVDKVRTGV